MKLKGSSDAVLNHSLVQFQRVRLKAGECRKVLLEVETKYFQTVNEEGIRRWEETETILYAGGSQPDDRSRTLLGEKPLQIVISSEERF